MKKLLGSTLAILFLIGLNSYKASAGRIPPVPVLITEQDGDPLSILRRMVYPNGTLVNTGGGVIEINVGSAGDISALSASTAAIQIQLDANDALTGTLGISTATNASGIAANLIVIDILGTSTGTLDSSLTAHINATSVHGATSSNLADRIVLRDISGNFSAGTITAGFTGALTGNADTATALAADPASCGANLVGTDTDASAALTCTALTDSFIPDTITASNYVLKAGDTMTGDLAMDGSIITTVSNQNLIINPDGTGDVLISTNISLGTLTIEARAAISTALVIIGFEGQTADLLSIRDELGNALFTTSPSGLTTIVGPANLVTLLLKGDSNATGSGVDGMLKLTSLSGNERILIGIQTSGTGIGGDSFVGRIAGVGVNTLEIYTGSPNDLLLGTNQTERMRFDRFGSIGININRGTNEGTLTIQSLDVGATTLILLAVADQTANLLSVKDSGGTDLFVVDQDGNVGIGVDPTEALDVLGNGLFSGDVTATNFIGDGSALTGIGGVFVSTASSKANEINISSNVPIVILSTGAVMTASSATLTCLATINNQDAIAEYTIEITEDGSVISEAFDMDLAQFRVNQIEVIHVYTPTAGAHTYACRIATDSGGGGNEIVRARIMTIDQR